MCIYTRRVDNLVYMKKNVDLMFSNQIRLYVCNKSTEYIKRANNFYNKYN